MIDLNPELTEITLSPPGGDRTRQARIDLNPELTEITLKPTEWVLLMQPQIISVEYEVDRVLIQLGGVAASLGGSTDWASPGAIGSTTPNTGRFTQLSTGTIHLIEKQLRPQLREIIDINGVISRVSIYSDSSKTTELYRKTLNRTSGTLNSVTETDYTTTPPTTRTKTLTRVNGRIKVSEVA